MKLDGREIEELLAVDVPAHLATIDPRGFPRVTPIWFVWADGAFYMTSVEGQPHLRNIDRQVKGYGEAELFPDEAGEWTRRITLKYIRGEAADATAARRAAMPRVVIRLRPLRMTARGT